MDAVLKKQLRIWMDLINQEKELLSSEVEQLKEKLTEREEDVRNKDQELRKVKEKLRNTEMVVTELTQSLTKVMAENYRRTNTPVMTPDLQDSETSL
jgi:chromosome segregation ATPase